MTDHATLPGDGFGRNVEIYQNVGNVGQMPTCERSTALAEQSLVCDAVPPFGRCIVHALPFKDPCREECRPTVSR